MNHNQYLSANNLIKPNLLIWEKGVETHGAGWSERDEGYAFRGQMCGEIMKTEDAGKAKVYGNLCKLDDMESKENREKVKKFTDKLIKALDENTVGKITGSWKESYADPAKRWQHLKELIPQKDIDNLIDFVQTADKYEIDYRNGMLTIKFIFNEGKTTQIVRDYLVVVDEEAASRYAADFPATKQWIADIAAARKNGVENNSIEMKNITNVDISRIDQAEIDEMMSKMGKPKELTRKQIESQTQKSRELIAKASALSTTEAARAKLDEIAGSLSEDVRTQLSTQLAELQSIASQATVNENTGEIEVVGSAGKDRVCQIMRTVAETIRGSSSGLNQDEYFNTVTAIQEAFIIE